MSTELDPRLYPFPPGVVIEALTKAGGVFLAAAATLGCDRDLIERYVENLPEVWDALSKIDTNNADMAQVAFLKAVSEGKSWAVDRAVSRAPARGRPANRPPGQGPGWGGPARTSEIGDARSLTAQIHATTDPAERARLVGLRRARMQEIIGEIAETADRPEVRLAAAAKLNQIDGGEPATKNVNFNANFGPGAAPADLEEMDDEQLAAELARLRGSGVSDPVGDEAESVPAPLSDVRH